MSILPGLRVCSTAAVFRLEFQAAEIGGVTNYFIEQRIEIRREGVAFLQKFSGTQRGSYPLSDVSYQLTPEWPEC